MAAALLLMAASVAAAQIGGGSISGTVTDDQGAVLPGVTVTLAGTDRTATTPTDEAGKFRFLESGAWRLHGDDGAPGLHDGHARGDRGPRRR